MAAGFTKCGYDFKANRAQGLSFTAGRCKSAGLEAFIISGEV
jgi:hypothetical protein